MGDLGKMRNNYKLTIYFYIKWTIKKGKYLKYRVKKKKNIILKALKRHMQYKIYLIQNLDLKNK